MPAPFAVRASALRAVAGLVAALIGLSVAAARAQERVTFPSLDGKTTLSAFLLRPVNPALHPSPRPALVLLHGCSGLLKDRRLLPIYRSWAWLFAAAGYVTLIVDSATPRGFGPTCTASPARRVMIMDRPKDAYAALQFLQSKEFVRPDRIGAVGWSQGGATILRAVAEGSSARPQGLAHDFRAAVTFYPGGCSERLQSLGDGQRGNWTTAVPLLALLGEADNWTPAAPCLAFLNGAKARGAPVEIKLYPGAPHVFDAPNLVRHELPMFRMRNGVVPIAGTDEKARQDALTRAPEFLRRYLQD
jgi:dienelactone hydrolase